MKKKLFIFGAQNFAEMAHYLFTSDSDYDVAGFTVDGAYLRETTFCGLPVVPFEEIDRVMDKESDDLYCAVGVARINTLRARKVAELRDNGFHLASFVSSHARVPPGFVAGPNTMVMDQVNIHPNVRVGWDTVIWSNSRLALKVVVGDHAWITSAVIGDSSVIGDYSFIGINATIAPFVKVGSHNLIGAAAVILRDTKDYEVYRGPRSVAAKVSSDRIENIPILR
jgi:sugar O-acyltransferase (sialic acid O-acetyltransferase NeuD family)